MESINLLIKEKKQFLESRISSANEYQNALGIKVIGLQYFVSLGDTNWILYSEIESEKALVAATKSAIFSSAVLITSIIIVLIAAVFVSSRFTRPIISLAKNAVNIALGKTHKIIDRKSVV